LNTNPHGLAREDNFKEAAAPPARFWVPSLAGVSSAHRDFVWTLGGNTVYSVCQWAMVLVLAKMGSPDMLGQFALGLAIATPVTLCTNLYLRAVIATDVREQYSFADYLGLRLITTLLALACIGILVFLGGFRGATAWVLLIVGSGKALDAICDLYMGFFQQRGRLDYLALSMIINGGVSLLALGALLWWTHDIVWAAAGSAFGSALALCTFCVPAGVIVLRRLQHTPGRAAATRNVLLPRFNAMTLRILALGAAPLGFASLRSVLSLNIPRYFVAYDLGERALGIFAAVGALVLAGLIVTTALGISLTQRLAGHYAAGDIRAFRRLMLRLVQIGLAQGAIGVVIALVAGRAVLSIVFGADYAPYDDLLVWLVLSASLYALISFFEMALTAMRRFNIQMWIQAVMLGILIGLCFWLTPPYGIQGAAVAMFISALLTMAAYALALTRQVKDGFTRVTPLMP
jgi:O-antigen/teichoic acid export membrane protein